MMESALEIKGTADGLLAVLPDDDWPASVRALLEAIDLRADFFRGAQLTLQLGGIEAHAGELGSLRDVLASREVHLRFVQSDHPATQEAAANLGLLARPRPPAPRPSPTDDEATGHGVEGEDCLFLQRTLRSGHKVHYPGHVVVLGDINPGAEIVAGGNVIVWGRLRGTVHAGAGGQESAVVCALDLAPTQLRIGAQIAVSPDRRGKPRPETALIRDGQLVAEPWSIEGKR
ncbi:MAG: septum site-determining protein MinC [Anaerolineales bacterium]|nr:septum site-determining protein MinC [Anaerolineales bacterium]